MRNFVIFYLFLIALVWYPVIALDGKPKESGIKKETSRQIDSIDAKFKALSVESDSIFKSGAVNGTVRLREIQYEMRVLGEQKQKLLNE